MSRVCISLTSVLVMIGALVAIPAPAEATDYPVKGKIISIIVTQAAGGGNDLLARAIAPHMEKQLGVPIQVINKVGAGGQVGWTDLALAKPDGYTLGIASLPGLVTIYLDPDRKAVFDRSKFQPISLLTIDPGVIAVRSDSPYKEMKDLVDAAKANPEKVKAGHAGILAPNHMAILQLQKIAGVRFAIVQFTGGAPMLTALLGGHIDAAFTHVPDAMSHFKSGSIRLLGLNDSQPSKFYPGVKTMETQGFKLYFAGMKGISAPGGTPKPVVETLDNVMKKAMESNELRKMLDDLAFTSRYMPPEEFAKLWLQVEEETKPLISLAKQ